MDLYGQGVSGEKGITGMAGAKSPTVVRVRPSPVARHAGHAHRARPDGHPSRSGRSRVSRPARHGAGGFSEREERSGRSRGREDREPIRSGASYGCPAGRGAMPYLPRPPGTGTRLDRSAHRRSGGSETSNPGCGRAVRWHDAEA
ncbi:hypothetical protein GCM10010517_68450 [Streptosporangium fragile]|uniref:Uncharacterized protein n=1 Tax=Streptosporangium fragile TaxID=46186 RepID=A0ABN3W7Y0_9ACTN